MHAQRTIAAYDNAGDRYSSNALIKGNSADNVRTEYVTNNSAQPVTIITVCNYDKGNPASPNTDQITYSVTAQLVRKNGVNYETVNTAYVSELETEDSCTYSITVTHSLGHCKSRFFKRFWRYFGKNSSRKRGDGSLIDCYIQQHVCAESAQSVS
jgi:hypothetical protein